MSADIIAALSNVFLLCVPEAILGLAACCLFLGSTFRADRDLWGWVALLSIGAALIALVATRPTAAPTAEAIFAGSLVVDHLAFLIKAIALIGGAVLVLFSWNDVPDRWAGEYHACLLVIVAGLCLTGAANELITLFLALELISIPTYVLLYLPQSDKASQEAALKYFLLSIFSSGLLLFGFSYLYGLAGTTNIPAILEALTKDAAFKHESATALPGVALIALVMIVGGLSFRITAVPFHFYAPDVYQGAPIAGAALLAFIPKVAGFVALVRVLGFVAAGGGGMASALGEQVPSLMWILAAVTMTLGNILALLQSNLKRLLAYSSVAHAGYMLIGLAVARQAGGGNPSSGIPGGIESILFYLVAYGAMTTGAFLVPAYLSTPERPVENEDDLVGLARSHPGVALFMALFLFSLIGLPLTAGFFGKLFLILGAMSVEGERALLFRWLAFIGVVNAAIGGWYYLRILAKMYLQSPIKPLDQPRGLGDPAGLTALGICAVVTLFLGIYPWPLVREATRAAAFNSAENTRLAAQRQPLP